MDNKPAEIPTEVRSFLESLLQDAKMQSLDENMKEEMLKELYVRLDNFMTSAIIDNMPPEHLDAFIKMNEEKKPKAEVEQYIKEKMPNAQDVFTKAFMEFRDLYLGNVAVNRNAPVSASNASDAAPTETPIHKETTPASDSIN